MKPGLMLLLYGALLVAPLVLSAIWGGQARQPLAEIGSALGMLAFAIILVEFVLSGRFRSISNSIGMDVTMRFHQGMGRAALLFALLHPFLYGGSPSGGPRPWDATRQLTLTTDMTAIGMGILAFALLPAFMIAAIYRKDMPMTYERWRLLHGLGAILISGLLLLHTVWAGRYAAVPVVAWYWYAMTGAALATLVHVYVLVPLRDRRLAWRVQSVLPAAPHQWSVTLEPLGTHQMTYEAGQFAWLNLGHSTFSLCEHPFSIASAPAAGPEVSFLIKEFGDFTSTIGRIPVGTRAYIDGPYGTLTITGRTEPGVALFAGGVGIAPLLGILREMRLTHDERARKLVYGNTTASQIVFADELAAEDTTFVLSQPPDDWQGATGMIDGALLDQLFGREQFDHWLFVLCGPAGMMDSVEQDLIARGVHARRILSERFDYD